MRLNPADLATVGDPYADIPGLPECGAISPQGAVCTRRNHPGRQHVAGADNRVTAVWSPSPLPHTDSHGTLTLIGWDFDVDLPNHRHTGRVRRGDRVLVRLQRPHTPDTFVLYDRPTDAPAWSHPWYQVTGAMPAGTLLYMSLRGKPAQIFRPVQELQQWLNHGTALARIQPSTPVHMN